MITKLRVRNFKSLADTGELDIKPLTILVGPNSSGKSAVLQSLLLLRQTADSRDVTNPLAISGSYMDFGSYRDMIHGHDDRKQLLVDLWYRPALPLGTLHGRASAAASSVAGGTEVHFSVEYKYVRKSMRVLLQKAWWAADSEWSAGMELLKGKDRDYRALLRINGNDIQFDCQRSKFYEFSRRGPLPRSESATVQARGDRSSLLSMVVPMELSGSVERLFRLVFYIGPLRARPERSYTASGQTPQDVGISGELSVDVLWIQTRRKTDKERMLGPVNRWMREFGVAQEVKLTRLAGTTYKLNIEDPHSGLDVNVADVGFGASQVLPVIVEGFYCPIDSMLLIEQPEIHLHPRAQATLGDLLLAIVGEQKTVIVETHSEHMISRIQRRIAEGEIESDKVAIYYCEASPEGTRIRRIRLNGLGQFETEGLPEGFFEEGYLESMEHMKAIVSRAGSV